MATIATFIGIDRHAAPDVRDLSGAIYAETPLQRQQLFARYVKGTLEPLRSSFDPKDLDTWIIRLLAQVESVPATDLIHLLCKSYGGYLENRRNPKWQHDMADTLRNMLQQMLELELVEEELGHIRLTLLGRACGTSTLCFASAMRLVRLVKETGVQSLTPVLLVSLLQALPELDRIYTPFFSKSGGREAAWPRRVSGTYGANVVCALQRFAPGVADGAAHAAAGQRFGWLWEVVAHRPPHASRLWGRGLTPC
jgi:helicase